MMAYCKHLPQGVTSTAAGSRDHYPLKQRKHTNVTLLAFTSVEQANRMCVRRVMGRC